MSGVIPQPVYMSTTSHYQAHPQMSFGMAYSAAVYRCSTLCPAQIAHAEVLRCPRFPAQYRRQPVKKTQPHAASGFAQFCADGFLMYRRSVA